MRNDKEKDLLLKAVDGYRRRLLIVSDEQKLSHQTMIRKKTKKMRLLVNSVMSLSTIALNLVLIVLRKKPLKLIDLITKSTVLVLIV